VIVGYKNYEIFIHFVLLLLVLLYIYKFLYNIMDQQGLLMRRTFETNCSYLSITISYILSSIIFISLSI